jgi:hypothetical protein
MRNYVLAYSQAWPMVAVLAGSTCVKFVLLVVFHVLFNDRYIYFCNMKPALSIGNYFVSNRFQDCIFFNIIV